MMELALSILSAFEKLAYAFSGLIGVYVGWKLATHSERLRRQEEALEKQFDAFRELRSVIDDIPRDATAEQLTEQMNTDINFRDRLQSRLVRLFGLRRELVPHLDGKIVSLIDQSLSPLYKIETGTYHPKTDRLEEFASCCVKLVAETDSLEKRLVKSYNKAIN